MIRKKVLISGAIALVALTSAATYAITYHVAMNRFNQVVSDVNERKAMYKKLSDIDQVIRQDYIEDINENEVLEGISKGYISGLGNSKVLYLDSEKYGDYLVATDPESIFLGIDTDEDDDGNIEVLYVYPGSLAESADIKKGDYIVAINDYSVLSMGYTAACNKLYGTTKDKITLNIERINADGNLDEMQKVIRYKPTNMSMVESKKLDNGVGYIKLSGFDVNTQTDLSKQLGEFKQKNINKYIIDLRNTRKGSYDSMARVADIFVPRGNIINVIGKDGGKKVEYKSTKTSIDGSLVVLTNDQTSGPAELLAAVLKDYRRATIIGETTLGSCEKLKTVELSDGSGIVVPVGYYASPKTGVLSNLGLVPNVEVELPEDQRQMLMQRSLEPKNDNQILSAIEQLNK